MNEDRPRELGLGRASPGHQASTSELEQMLSELHAHVMLRPLMGGLAHHFNNLLSGILGWVSLAPTLPADTLTALSARVKEQVDHASRLTRLVLSITRRAEEAAATPMCELGQWSGDALALVKTATPPHVTLVPTFPETEVWAGVSPVIYARLLLDLLMHAVQAGDPSQPYEVRLEVAAVGGACRITLESPVLRFATTAPRALAELMASSERGSLAVVWATASTVVQGIGGSLTQELADGRPPRWVIDLPSPPRPG